MRYKMKTELNANGSEIFSKTSDGKNIYYILKSEKGEVLFKTRDWVLRNSKDVINLTVTSDKRLVVKSKKKVVMEHPKKVTKSKSLGMTIGDFKAKQLDVIKKYNPMNDDYHTGIRTVNDIKVFKEAIQDDESFVYGDFEMDDALDALHKGKVRVYSSKPIQQGVFVSTSRNMAKDYAGKGEVYEKEVALTDVAWINGDEGQYAKVM